MDDIYEENTITETDPALQNEASENAESDPFAFDPEDSRFPLRIPPAPASNS